MTDCPHCDKELAQIGKKYKKKFEIVPIQRRYKGGIITTAYGYNIGQLNNIPEGAMKVDECKSCHWKSIWRKDGQSYQHGQNLQKTTGPTWRLLECGTNIDVIFWLRKYGFKR